MTAQDAFKAAEKLDIEQLYRYVREGNEINIINDDGISMLCAVVKSYLELSEEDYTPEEQQTIKVQTEKDEDEFWNSFLHEERKKPLCKRHMDIQNVLDFLFAHGADPNAARMVNGFVTTPLMAAVCHLDYELAFYLLQHHADPGVKLCSDSTIKNGKDYWLMDEMDIRIMHDATGERAMTAARIAGLLHRHGLTEWKGYCIDFCEETEEVVFHPLWVKF